MVKLGIANSGGFMIAPLAAKQHRGSTNYGDQFMACPECGGTAEAEAADVGVGLYIKDEYECPCGWNSVADGRIDVASYDGWFVGYDNAH